MKTYYMVKSHETYLYSLEWRGNKGIAPTVSNAYWRDIRKTCLIFKTKKEARAARTLAGAGRVVKIVVRRRGDEV